MKVKINKNVLRSCYKCVKNTHAKQTRGTAIKKHAWYIKEIIKFFRSRHFQFSQQFYVLFLYTV